MDITLDNLNDNRDKFLKELAHRQAIVRDFVRGVANQYHTGFYLFGRPGTAKTHIVKTALAKEKQPYVYWRGHITPIGLFELIADNPDDVIVLDDLSTIFRNDIALQILLAALEHPVANDNTRFVKYARQGKNRRIAFRGGILCISNRELHDGDLLCAFRSRVPTLNFDPSDGQLGALILGLAKLGWPIETGSAILSSIECQEVATLVISEMLRLSCRFDLRLYLNKALPIYLQWKDDECESDWRDLVRTAIEEHVKKVRYGHETAVARDARKEAEQALVRDIVRTCATREDRIRAWEIKTGKSERAFYRRLAEIDTH